MLTHTYLDSKSHQIDYQKRAAHFRLVKSLEKPASMISRVLKVFGNALVTSGEQLTHTSGSIQ